jgi:hypothetical protein
LDSKLVGEEISYWRLGWGDEFAMLDVLSLG